MIKLKMDKERKEIILIVGVLFLALVVMVLILNSGEEKYNSELINEQEILNKCSNLSLDETVGCIVKGVGKIPTFDCRNYALLYEQLGKDLGFAFSTTFRLGLDNSAHRFATISDGKDYCIVEQTFYFCMRLGESK